MNTQRYRQQNNTLLLIVTLFGIMAFAAFLLVLAAYLTQTPRETVATPPTVSTPPQAPNRPIQAVSAAKAAPTPISPEVGPVGTITTPTAAPLPPPLVARPAPTDEALVAYRVKVATYLDQCQVLNKLLQKNPALSDYRREHETASSIYLKIPEELPAGIKPDQARIVQRTLADLDQLADIDAINIAQRDKCLLNAAGCEEEGNTELATKFRVLAGGCEESLLKNIDHRKKIMGIVEKALTEGTN